ncbi:MAG: hypothetical protein IPH45_20300 [Bacteroidales bacterium]|nr:hypothetical protein [Bacteroidales bacterium]
MISVGDTIWYLSQTEGLFCSYNGHIKYFRKEDPTLPKILNDIFIDGMGNIILGSNNGEIIIASYQRTGLKIKHRLQTGNEIVGNTVKFLVVDHTQHLYIGTNLGLNRIDLHKLYNNNQLVVNFYDNEIGYYDPRERSRSATNEIISGLGQIIIFKIDSRKLDGQSGEIHRLN